MRADYLKAQGLQNGTGDPDTKVFLLETVKGEDRWGMELTGTEPEDIGITRRCIVIG